MRSQWRSLAAGGAENMFFIFMLFPQKVNEGSKSKSLRITQNSRETVPPRRLERPTSGLGNRCSIHLSYGGYEIL